MKVLVLSILRIGDLAMHREILENMVELHRGIEVELVINSQFEKSFRALGYTGKLKLFPRQFLQENLVHRDLSFFRAYGKVKTWLQDLRAQEYDCVVDLTHNYISRAIVTALGIPELNNKKNTYLNEVFAQSKRSSFHYVDALRLSVGLPPQSSMRTRSRNGSSVAKKQIVIQALTSDIKKTWSAEKFKSLSVLLCEAFSDYRLIFVGSSSEEEYLKRHFYKAHSNIEIKVCNLEELAKILSGSDLLITGDTATLHIASDLGVRSLSLFLGSAEPTKTGPRLSGSIVVQAQESCVPCRHSSDCAQATFLCEEQISVSLILDLAKAMIMDREQDLSKIAWDSENIVSMASWNKFGVWELRSLTAGAEEGKRTLRHLAWTSVISGQQAFSALSDEIFPGEPWEISLWLQDEERNLKRNMEITLEIQSEIRKISRACLRLDVSINTSLKVLKDLVEEFVSISDDEEWSSVMSQTYQETKSQSPFVVYRRWKTMAELLEQFLSVEIKIVSLIKHELRKKGLFYVPPSRAT